MGTPEREEAPWATSRPAPEASRKPFRRAARAFSSHARPGWTDRESTNGSSAPLV